MSATLPKLVRDRIPEKIIDGGNTPAWHTATSLDEHTHLLHDKINEEFLEFVDTPSLEEAADCLEVLRGLFSLHGYSIEEVLDAADQKADDCGGFYYGIILGAINAGTP